MKLFAKKRWQSRTDIPPEYAVDPNKEIAAPPDEYNLNAPIVKREERKPSTVRKIMLYLASIGIVILGVITPIVRLNETEDAAQATPASSAVAHASEPTPLPAPTAVPTTAVTAEPTPIDIMAGKIHVVVYSEIFDTENAGQGVYPSRILDEQTFEVSTFAEYRLPELPEQEGYTAIGYVLLAEQGQTYLNSLIVDGEAPHPIGTVALGGTLTIDDLGILPNDGTETHEAEIHAVWTCVESDHLLQFYDEELFGEYHIGFLPDRDQLCCLAAFPEPTRPDKTFVGWCDAEGHMIDVVTRFDFYQTIPPAETPEDRDWNHPVPCKVYACWSDGTRGTIRVPREERTGRIHVTIYSELPQTDAAGRTVYESEIYREATFDAATFTEYTLPRLPKAEGYTAIGYVLLADSGEAYRDSLYDSGAQPHSIGSVLLGNTLRAEDLDIVPKNVTDVCEAEIHVVWLWQHSAFELQFYDGEELLGAYYVGFPLADRQLCYLAPFPKPEKRGKTFTGWCDAEGHMIDAVTYYDFFEKLSNARKFDDRDLEKRIPCKVYACWSDGSGGAPPTPVPTPKPTPRPTPVPPQHTFTCSSRCGFSKGSFGGSKTVYEGQRVTIYASAEGWSGAGIFQTGTGDMISVSPYTHDGDVYWYRYTFTGGDRDLKISFMYS